MLDRLRPVFESLQRHDVRYVAIGGVAAILHGVPRITLDLDVLIEASPDNARRLLAALEDARLGSATMITAEALLRNDVTIFDDRVRIDVQTVTPGIRFEDVWPNRQTMTFQGQSFYILSLPDLIASKRAAGRPQDLEDVRLLEVNTTGDEFSS